MEGLKVGFPALHACITPHEDFCSYDRLSMDSILCTTARISGNFCWMIYRNWKLTDAACYQTFLSSWQHYANEVLVGTIVRTERMKQPGMSWSVYTKFRHVLVYMGFSSKLFHGNLRN